MLYRPPSACVGDVIPYFHDGAFGHLRPPLSTIALPLGRDGMVGRQLPACVGAEGALGTAVVESGSFAPLEAPLPLRGAEHRSIRLYVDGSLVELFLDDEVTTATRWYAFPPTRFTAHGPGAVVPSDLGRPWSRRRNACAPAVTRQTATVRR